MFQFYTTPHHSMVNSRCRYLLVLYAPPTVMLIAELTVVPWEGGGYFAECGTRNAESC